MKYRINPKNGDKLSTLAFGCMRFPKDESQVERQLLRAIDGGVNYFDTAYIYPGSESTLGRILYKNGVRERVNIATKLPHYLVNRHQDLDRIFSAELKRLQTDYIDYYLIHMLTGLDDWLRLTEMGVVGWIEDKKRTGAIRNLGFSFHGGASSFLDVLDAYNWDMCMIQYNYYDEYNQAGKSGLERAVAKGIPVMVMEPLRGGKLVRLPQEARKVFDAVHPDWSPAEWGFRWVLDHPGVLTVLSGMNTMDMVEENIRVASQMEPNTLTPAEREACEAVRGILAGQNGIPCTGCNYCMPCPFGVDIPLCFSIQNDTALMPKYRARFNYALRVREHKASRCTRCGKCVSHCPQSIRIPDELAGVVATMEPAWFRPASYVIQKAMKRG